MTLTCKGAEFNAFMQDSTIWMEGCWFDDVYAEVNGQPDELERSFQGDDVLPADAAVLIQGGEYHTGPAVNSTFYSFEQKLKEWLNARKVTVLVIEIENEHLETQRAAIEKLTGVKILG